jgi:hypothetical protein
MKDPLTKEQHDAFFVEVRKVYDEKYASALACGAIAETEVITGSHVIAKCVLQLVPVSFAPVGATSRAVYKNLVHFI